MSRLLILGAGQYGMVAKEVAEAMGCFEQIDFLDDNSDLAIGKLDDIRHLDCDSAFVAIGNPDVREIFFNFIKKPVTLIHPDAVIMPSAKIGDGCIIEAGVVICSNSIIGKATIIMSNAVVGHDAEVGSFCQLKYNSTVPARMIVPDKTKLDYNLVWNKERLPCI